MANLGVDGAYPQYGTDGTGNYTPQLYANKTLIKFYKNTVFGDIANTDYEGMIKSQGDKVVIRTVPDVTIKAYTKGMDLVYDSPDGSSIELEINKAKYYALKIDKIDEVQNDLKQMDRWTDDAGKRLAISIDTEVLANMYTAAHASNIGLTAGADSGAYNMGTVAAPISLHTGATTAANINVIDAIMYAESALSELDVPEDEGRWIVLPTWACMLLQTSDLRRADSQGASAAQEVLRNGKLGRLGNFTIYRSNNLPKSGSDTIIPFGHKTGLTFATQLVDTEMLPHPTNFGTIMRGLQVFGYKVVKPESMGYMVANKL